MMPVREPMRVKQPEKTMDIDLIAVRIILQYQADCNRFDAPPGKPSGRLACSAIRSVMGLLPSQVCHESLKNLGGDGILR